MALTFNDGQNNEIFTILNLFNTEDNKVHGLAYTLLCARLREMSEQTLNHKYFQQFVQNLVTYFQTANGVPGKVDAYIYNLFSSVVDDNRNMIEASKGEKRKLEYELESLRKTHAKSEEEKKQLAVELESLRKKNAELESKKSVEEKSQD